MMMFRLWQNALLEKVSAAQPFLQPQDAHPPEGSFPWGEGPMERSLFLGTLASSREAHVVPEAPQTWGEFCILPQVVVCEQPHCCLQRGLPGLH